MNDVENVIHQNRLAILHALHSLGGSASVRELHLFLHRYSEDVMDLPSILFHLENLNAVRVSEREAADGHEYEGVPPHDVSIVDYSLVDTLMWLYDQF